MENNKRFEWIKLTDEENKIVKEHYGPLADERLNMMKTNPELITLPQAFLRYQDKMRQIMVRPDDVWIVSNPKTGTTWTEDVVWLLLTNLDTDGAENIFIDTRIPFIDYPLLLNFSDEEIDNYLTEIDNRPSPRIFKTHVPFEFLPPNLLDTCKVIFPCRNLKDTAVSYYHHESMFTVHDLRCEVASYLKNIYRTGLTPYGGYWGMFESGWSRRSHPNMLFFWFEEMKRDQMAVITKIAGHLGRADMAQEDLEKINSFMMFDNYKKKAATNKPNKFVQESQEGQFIRKGKIGDWKSHFGEELVENYDQWIMTNLNRIGISDPTVVKYFDVQTEIN